MRKLLFAIMLITSMLAAREAAAADAGVVRTPAVYKGRTIDLSRGWEGARACAVIRTGDIRCFDSEAEQWRELAKLRRPSGPVVMMDDVDEYCLDRTDLFLILYENTSFGGASLSLNTANVWHDLASLSFDNMTSSWKNNTYCDATAATGTSGSGSTTTFASRSQNTDVGSTWNDVISSDRINP